MRESAIASCCSASACAPSARRRRVDRRVSRTGRRMIAAATADHFAWQRLALLTDTFGNRLSGSQALEDAIAWAAAEMAKDGLDDGPDGPGEGPALGPRRRVARADRAAPSAAADARASASRASARRPTASRPTCSSSTASPSSSARSAEARGRSSLFNAPYQGYGQTVAYRTNGASQAAEARRARDARALGRPRRPPHAAHRHADLSRGRAEDSRRGDHRRRRRSGSRAWRRAASACVSRLKMGAEMLARRRLGQRDRRTPRPREARRDRRRRRATSTRGMSAPAPATTAAAAVAAWEVARLLKQLDLRPRRTDPRRAVHQRGERPARRARLPGRAIAPIARPARADDRVRPGVFAPSGSASARNETARAQVAAIAALLRADWRHARRAVGRRRRHRPQRRGGPDPGDVARSGRRRSTSLHPPHRGRHRRQDRPDGPGQVRRRDGGDDVRRGRHAAALRRVAGHA